MGKSKAKNAGKMIVCRVERCMACRACEIACTLEHSQSKELVSAIREEPKPQRRVTVEAAGGHGLPLQCRHCENAPCVMICPTEAIHRESETGPVLIDGDRCIGCKMCLAVCPFGVIEPSCDGKAVVKCDLCIERTKAGLEPACVVACPTKALQFLDFDEYNRRKRKAAAKRIQAEAEEAARR
jgi:carbon-monoxide dehydrogenase iron sulfur subunit